MRFLLQLIGSIVAAALLVIVVLLFPKVIYDAAWPDEQRGYEHVKQVEAFVKDKINAHGAEFDRLRDLSSLNRSEIEIFVADYVVDTIPNESVLAQAQDVFTPQWTESTARTILLENALLVDYGRAEYPSNKALYATTALSMLNAILDTIICASMIAFYLQATENVLYYLLGMHTAPWRLSSYYTRSSEIREGIVLIVAVCALIGAWAQIAIFAYLQYGDTWSLVQVLWWTAMQALGVGNSSLNPVQMKHGEISFWLTLVDFFSLLNASAAHGFVIVATLRCWKAKQLRKDARLKDSEIRRILAVDAARFKQGEGRPMYHYN